MKVMTSHVSFGDEYYHSSAIISKRTDSVAFPFEARTIEWVLRNCSSNDVLHKHDHYEIIWVTSGSASLVTDLSRFEIKENFIVHISPGQVHRLIAGED